MLAKKLIYNTLSKKVALGNSDTGFKHVACDLLHASGEKPSKIAEGTFLSTHTIERVMKCEDNYKPQSDTLERIFKYMNAQVAFNHVNIKAQYRNKPKVEQSNDDE